MKISFKHIIPALGAVALLTACDENSWNDKLDGFEQPDINQTVSTIEYILTTADYAKIAKEKANTAMVEGNEAEAAELAAIGTSGTFTSDEQARKFIPAFLRDSTFEYFALSDGANIRVTYNLTTNLPETVAGINKGAKEYKVSEADYQGAWGSDKDFINGFAPMCAPATSLPGILKAAYPDAVAGDYVLASYNYSSVNPIFGEVGGGDEPELPLEPGEYYIVAGGNVIAMPLAADKSYGYLPKGDVTVSGGVVNTDAANAFTFTAVQGGYTIQDASGRYLYQSGTYNSFNVSTEAVDGSTWTITIDNDGLATITNASVNKSIQYDSQYSSWGSYPDLRGTLPVLYKKDAAKKAPRRAPVESVKPVAQYAIYTFNGSAWSAPANTIVIQPEDYTAMGETHGNLSGTGPDVLLPKFLASKLPYAAEEDAQTVVFKYYDSSSKVTSVMARQLILTNGVWTPNYGAATDKFTRKDGYWKYNPSVELNITKGAPDATTVYMACVKWVYDNVSLKMEPGCDITAAPFIYKGKANAEYWSGTSSYYGNTDVRASTAENNAPEGYTGYDGLTADQITALIKQRFCLETMRGTLESLYPEMNTVPGMEVTYSVTFTSYAPATTVETVTYTVVGPGKLRYKSCTWFEANEDEGWE